METSTHNRTEDSDTAKSRAAAKARVLQTWSQRRSRSQCNNLGDKAATGATEQHPDDLSRHQDSKTTDGLPSVCKVIQFKWMRFWNGFFAQRNQSVVRVCEDVGKTTTFSSVKSILESNELVKQIDSIRGDGSSDEGAQSVALSVLPAGYDWNLVFFEMAQQRNRAFLLVDLTSIIRLTHHWRRTHHPRIRFLYSVKANADSKLLKYLSQSGWSTLPVIPSGTSNEPLHYQTKGSLTVPLWVENQFSRKFVLT